MGFGSVGTPSLLWPSLTSSCPFHCQGLLATSNPSPPLWAHSTLYRHDGDLGSIAEPLSPPPVLSQPNFNPIMSARYQLQRLLGAGLSQFGLGPRDRATSSHGDGSVGGADPRVNITVPAAATPTSFQPRSSPDPAAVGSSPVSAGSTICAGNSRTYTYQELQAATGDFSSQNKLGRGGYGTVYCGWLDGISVAVKVMDTSGSCMQVRHCLRRHPV